MVKYEQLLLGCWQNYYKKKSCLKHDPYFWNPPRLLLLTDSSSPVMFGIIDALNAWGKNHAFILHFSREEKELGKIMNMKDMHALDNIIAPKSKYGFALLIV